MTRNDISLLSLFWLCPLLSLTIGCAAVRMSDPPTEDIAEKRRTRADEAAQRFDSSHDFAQLQDAATRWKQGDAEGCEEELLQLLVRNPNHREARLFLADVCMADERRQEAREHVQAVLDADPHDARANRTMGLLHDSDGKQVEAAGYDRQAAEADSANEVSAMGDQNASSEDFDSVGFADAFGRSGDDGSAERSKTEGKQPTPAEVSQDTFPVVTTVQIRGTGSADPNDPQIPISAAVAALRGNQPERAVELLNTARQHFPNSVAVHRILGVAYYRLGDYGSSQVALQQALSLDNSAAVSYFLMGCTQAKLGQLESADANFRRARGIDPTYSTRR